MVWHNFALKTRPKILAPEAFLSKVYKTIKQVFVDIHHTSYFGFLAILNNLSCNTLSAAVPLVKSLKSPIGMTC